MLIAPPITFRPIDPDHDAAIVSDNYRDTCLASCATTDAVATYLPWLARRVEEFPDGHLLAFLENDCVGQLELQVPYGKSDGYVNLFCVTRAFRGKGFGRLLHDRAEQYFRSWEATTIELDVHPANHRALRFYLGAGYTVRRRERTPSGTMWRMSKTLT